MSKFTRKLKSMIGGQLVHRQRDDWGELLVLDQRRRRILTFGTAFEQSAMDREQPSLLVHDYARAMMLVLAWCQPRSATLLGLGGGSLVRALAHHFPELDIEAVELRQAVVDIARQWFGLPEGDTVRIHTADAGLHLQQMAETSTDLILADLFSAHGMSAAQTGPGFLHHCRRVLTDQGWLVVNLHGLPEEMDPIVRGMQSLFAEVFLCPVQGGNDIYFASVQPRPGPIHQHYEAMQQLEEQLNIRLDLLYRRLLRPPR